MGQIATLLLIIRIINDTMVDMPISRVLQLPKLLEKKSHFLLGPRATGKSFLIRQQLGDGQAVVLNLLKGDLYLRLSQRPEALGELLALDPEQHWVVIDEVQKIPALLDEVQTLIEERGLRFLLTGSSARKLKRGQANLLAGRAWPAELFPLCFSELTSSFDLDRYLRYGGLPAVYLSQDPQEELNAYVRTYLYEEIQAEGFVRKLPQFSRFLKTAALSNAQQLNFAHVANDAQVPATTVREYYQILVDTLLGFMLEPWTHSTVRKAISTAKFYFFDVGVVHTMAQTQTLDRNSDLYGMAFEHWVAMELRAYLSYSRKNQPLRYWRSAHQHEVDFVVGEHTAIEVKATRSISDKNLRGLKALAEEKVFQNYYLVSQDPIEAKSGLVHCVHWKTFMEMLWADQIL